MSLFDKSQFEWIETPLFRFDYLSRMKCFISIIVLLSCMNLTTYAQPDPHSAARPAEAVITHLSLNLVVDFDAKRLKGKATYRIDKSPQSREIWLDTRNLKIEAVRYADGSKANYSWGEEKPFLGKPLRIELQANTQSLTIDYSTTDGAEAIQWLESEQTQSNKPFLFTQGQAILTRTWIPIQDSPGIRFTWDAEVKTPPEFMAVMSGRNIQKRNDTGVYSAQMELPVPAYLIALAVGELEFAPIGDRCGVYAEPQMLKAAAYEFADVEKMLLAAESLYGPYLWGRYDVLVLPPSFPFGGMENPRLTFATPTIIAGDRSLTALIAHELAHSWSGNLVTNSNWNDFWLNEGFTVYFERRIMEALYGADYAQMLEVLGHGDLMATLNDMGMDSPDTRLKLSLEGRDPDDGMSDIAYEKGCFLLCYLEEEVGRPAFDSFLKRYFKEFAFKGITTERFIQFLNKQLKLSDEQKAVVQRWILSPGLPAECKVPKSTRFDTVQMAVQQFINGNDALNTRGMENWTSHEWLFFIRNLPIELSQSQIERLLKPMGWYESGNAEIRFAWLMNRVQAGDTTAFPHASRFLSEVGRRKFVLPLYSALLNQASMRNETIALFNKQASRYHAVTRNSVEERIKSLKK